MRLDNWQNNLSGLIEERRNKPFNFIDSNCLLWAFDAIEAVTGNDLFSDYRGKYKSEMQASLLLRKTDDVKTSEQLLVKKLGKTRKISFARQGDIVFVNPKNIDLFLPADIKLFGLVPGVCYGSTSFFVGEFGLVQVQTLMLGKTIWVS